jgi:hypothetical protein
MNPLRHAYRLMLTAHGHQGWWPGETPFEVCVGAILTQNTAWKNVEVAIRRLREAEVLEPRRLFELPEATLAGLIRPALTNGKPSKLGEASIAVYALDRPQLQQYRNDAARRLLFTIKQTERALRRHQRSPANQDFKEEYEECLKELRLVLSPTRPYTGMTRQIVRANCDTFHTTNCSPQVAAFNRSNLGGVWRELENYVLAQAKTDRYSLFAGPVLADDDWVFEGKDDRGAVRIQIPRKFWKVVLATAGGSLQAFAFLLEQNLSDVPLSEEEFRVSDAWTPYLVSFDELEEFCATGDITIGSLRELSVFRPDGSLKYGLHGARIPLLVWQTDNFDLCGILDVPHLTGTGNMFASDNDFNVSLNRTESTVGSVHGTVTSEDGQSFRFTQKFHAVILRTGELRKFVSTNELTPIGH